MAITALMGSIITTAEGQEATSATASQADSDLEVVITGTSIRGAKPVGTEQVSVQREDIQAIGSRTTTEILAAVPQMGFFNDLPRAAITSSGLSTPVDLRGLGGGATLVLLDGHRLIGDFPLSQVANPSSIPPAAIERIEIVTDGASAIYGSDAVAGVVNIITRKNMNGAETQIRNGWGRGDYGALDISQVIGRDWGSGSAMGVVAYSKNDPLRASDLGFYTSDFSAFGGTDQRPINCPNPNLRIGSDIYAPPNYSLGDAARCEPGLQNDVYSGQSSKSVLANLHQVISEKMRLFADVKFTRLDADTSFDPNPVDLTLSSSNPYFFAPAGVTATSATVLFDPIPVTGLTTVDAMAKSANAIIGADYSIGRWQATASYNYGWSDSNTTTSNYNIAALSSAAAGTTLDTALDPFGGRTSASVIDAIRNNVNIFAAKQRLDDIAVKVDGPVFGMPGGDLRLAVGAAYRRMGYDASQANGVRGIAPSGSVSATRDVNAAFGEVLVPVLGKDNSLPFVKALDLSAAIRYDDYNDVGSTSNPKFGVNWTLVDGLSIRGNYGSSFHAPDMGDSYAVDTRVLFFPSFPIVPPGRPTGSALVLAGGNTGLKPETADTYSIGLDFSPTVLPALKLSTTFYDIKYKNQIKIPPISVDLFTNAAYANFYLLDPTAEQVAALVGDIRLENVPTPLPVTPEVLDLRRQNLQATHTNGVDFETSYSWQAPFGAVSAGLAGNKILVLQRQGSAGQPFIDDRSVPRWRVRGSLAWQSGSWAADTAVNYLGSFENPYTTALGGSSLQNVKPFTTVDLHSSYALDATGILAGVTLSLNVSNLFGKDPPVQLLRGDSGAPSGYSRSANPLGRMLWAGVEKNFGW